MNTNFRKLQLIRKIFPLENFYSITIDGQGIKLQGDLDKKILEKAKLLKFQYEISENKYIIQTRGNIRIVLT